MKLVSVNAGRAERRGIGARTGAELGAVPEPGTFGENLTLSSFGDEPVRIGDRYRIGAALVEATARDLVRTRRSSRRL